MDCILIGAYGREASFEDWKAGKDFKIVGGPYCSIRDQEKLLEQYDSIQIVSRIAEPVASIFTIDNVIITRQH